MRCLPALAACLLAVQASGVALLGAEAPATCCCGHDSDHRKCHCKVCTHARELVKIRASGVGTDVGEYLDGSVCLAVPVRDPLGRMCATIAVHGPAPRMTLKKGYTFLPAMRKAADAMAATLFSTGGRLSKDGKEVAT